MTTLNSRGPLRGIVPPLVTPLQAPDCLDAAGFERLIEHLLAGGVHGLFVLGTTGEGPSLSGRLRREVIDRACRIARGRAPVLVGITDTSFAESMDLARHAATAGAQAVVASAPYYFLPSQQELAEYLERLAADLPLPLFLYNIPQMTRAHFGLEIVRRLMDRAKVIGIKDSSGDAAYLRELLAMAKQRPDWAVFVGQESLLTEALAGGGHGGVVGGANIHPKLYVQLYEAAMRGEPARVAELAADMGRLGEIYRVGDGIPGVVKSIKTALSLVGICGERMADPLRAHGAPEKDRVRAALTKAGLLK